MIKNNAVLWIVAAALAVLLVLPTALCEQPAWDCPECGRVGNTGNYCGGCGHPAPTLTPASTPAPAAAPTANPAPESIQAGDILQFGHYPQTAAGNDNTPIEWLVLEREGNKALLISRYGLDAKPYNKEYADTTWEKCTLRTWLNGTFLNKAFTAQEQKGILTTSVDNSKSQGYSDWSTNGGNNTQDRIFLLSCAEVNKYFEATWEDSHKEKARTSPTAYALQAGAWASNSYETAEGAAGWWWLRSPGLRQSYAARMDPIGSLGSNHVNYVNAVVRPALWINLESGIF